jgi:predicted glycogen debranching enzyme
MKLPAISLNGEMLSRLDEAIQREWIITNGLGGYASSTILGINTRKYHGLLVAAFHSSGDRRVCLEKLDEEVVIGNSVYPLGACEFQDRIFPQGHTFLKEFAVSPFPKSVYAVQGVEVQKTVFMPHERNVAVVLYKIFNRSSFDVRFRVFPLANWRHFHLVTDKWKLDSEPSQRVNANEMHLSIAVPKTALMMKAIGGRYFASAKWLESVYYREEARRGESSLDDCFQTGFFEYQVKTGSNESFAVSAVADEDEDVARKVSEELPDTLYDMGALYEKQLARRENGLAKFYGSHVGVHANDWLSALVSATDSFVVRGTSAELRSVIAGYHWFECWGRDAFVSLPGLMLLTRRFEDARKVFLGYVKFCRHGLIPNFIPDPSGEPVYNSVDATLWFANAILQYVKHTGDFEFVRQQLWQVLKEILDFHVRGTVFGIHVDNDGLLAHDGQLTWMDAAVDGHAVTPRAGKAVEVQALWFNALKTMQLLGNRFGESAEAERFGSIGEKARKSFVEKFWNADGGHLFDVVNNEERDGSLRPNQILAISLDFVMLDNEKSERIVDVVQRELLTPFGLRTLSWKDPRYVGVYAGDRRSRDRAYHNGSVWPWLLGPFTTAFLKTKGHSEFRRDYALNSFLSPLFNRHVLGVGLGTVCEILDGDAPHAPRGCIAQAWSVAEPLRAYVEDIVQVKPKYEKEVLQV